VAILLPRNLWQNFPQWFLFASIKLCDNAALMHFMNISWTTGSKFILVFLDIFTLYEYMTKNTLHFYCLFCCFMWCFLVWHSWLLSNFMEIFCNLFFIFMGMFVLPCLNLGNQGGRVLFVLFEYYLWCYLYLVHVTNCFIFTTVAQWARWSTHNLETSGSRLGCCSLLVISRSAVSKLGLLV